MKRVYKLFKKYDSVCIKWRCTTNLSWSQACRRDTRTDGRSYYQPAENAMDFLISPLNLTELANVAVRHKKLMEMLMEKLGTVCIKLVIQMAEKMELKNVIK